MRTQPQLQPTTPCLFVALFALALAIVFSGLQSASAQQAAKMSRIGILDNERSLQAPRLEAFRQELRNLGWVEGENLIIEARIGPREQFAALANQLVRLNLDLIFAPKSPAEVQAALGTAKSIPIVIAVVPDPVAAGYAASLSRPGGVVTGLSSMLGDIAAKQLELLKASVPRARRVAVFQNPAHPSTSRLMTQLKATEKHFGVQLTPITVDTPGAVAGAFARASKVHTDALLILPNALLIPLQAQVADLAVKHRLPGMAVTREAVEAGLLMSYGPDQTDLYRRAAIHVDKILKGANPAELPIEQPTKFEVVVNMKTAKTLGLELPRSLLLRADHVIE